MSGSRPVGHRAYRREQGALGGAKLRTYTCVGGWTDAVASVAGVPTQPDGQAPGVIRPCARPQRSG